MKWVAVCLVLLATVGRVRCQFGWWGTTTDDDQVTTTAAVEGNWGEWTTWIPCSQSCGDGGVEKRRRECDNPPPTDGGKGCAGVGEEERRCNKNPSCPLGPKLPEDDGAYGGESLKAERIFKDIKGSIEKMTKEAKNAECEVLCPLYLIIYEINTDVESPPNCSC